MIIIVMIALLQAKVDIVWRYLESSLSEVPQNNLNLSSKQKESVYDPDTHSINLNRHN